MDDDSPRVTLVTEYFHPEEASTAQLMTDLVIGLTDRFSVSVLTAYPNYHDDDRSIDVQKQSAYRGVDVRRVRSTRFAKDWLPARVANWATFTGLVFFHLLVNRTSRDALVVLSNPPVLAFAALANKWFRGSPFVHIVYDMYPDMPVALGLIAENGVIARLWERAMQVVYRNADEIVVLGESMKKRLAGKLADTPNTDQEKIQIIENWADGEFIQPRDKDDNEFAREHGTVDGFTVLYSGNVGRFHELETVIDAIDILEARRRMDIELLVIGEGARKTHLRSTVEDRGIENVKFLPFQPIERLPETLTCGDASLVGIKPEMEGMCVSSKLYSSLAAGCPILAVVGEGDEVASVVREHDCGAYVRPGDAEAAADILERWADDQALASKLGANARQCFEDQFTRAHAIEKYTELLDRVTRKD